MKPTVRVATTADGYIEATSPVQTFSGAQYRVVVDRRTGNVTNANIAEGTDMFRWLVTAAREHVAP